MHSPSKSIREFGRTESMLSSRSISFKDFFWSLNRDLRKEVKLFFKISSFVRYFRFLNKPLTIKLFGKVRWIFTAYNCLRFLETFQNGYFQNCLQINRVFPRTENQLLNTRGHWCFEYKAVVSFRLLLQHTVPFSFIMNVIFREVQHFYCIW